MPAPIFIGDEVTAAGYRLAGARVLIAQDGAAGDAFAAALEAAELVLVTAACARTLPQDQLERALRAADPLILLVPDAAARVIPPDVAADVGRALGIGS